MKANSLLCLILAAALIIVCAKMAIGGNGKADDTATTDSTAVATNPALDNIMTRASVRTFQPKAVEDEKVEQLLRAAMAAPSSKDLRPSRFVVVTDKDQLAAIAAIKPKGADLVARCPLAIVVCGDMRKTVEGEGRSYWVQDASAATENMLLAAHALGLGAVWTGFYPMSNLYKPLAKQLELPAEVVPMSVVAIGYPAQQPKVKDKWDESLVSYDAYDE